MGKSLKKVKQETSQPTQEKPNQRQVAALCYRHGDNGPKVLLVTTRGTGRWIIPKGWRIRGKSSSESAMQEAWEEAGVTKGKLAKKSIGSFFYKKVKDNGDEIGVKTSVYPIAVKQVEDKFPEHKQRRRKWVSLKKAANMVKEPELKKLLRNFADEVDT